MVPTALAILVYGMISALLGTLLPDLSGRLSLTDGQNGTVAFVQSLGLTISCLLTGPLIDRKGNKAGLAGGLGVVTLALFLLAKASGFLAVTGSMLFLGLGSGMISTSSNTISGELSPENRSSTLTWMNLFFGLGGLLTPLIGYYLIKGDKLALCYLIAVLAAAVFLANMAAPPVASAKTHGFSFSEAVRITTDPSLLLISLMLFLYVGCEVGVWNWLAKHMVSQGIPETTALRTLSLGFALGILLGRMAGSRVLVHVSVLNVTFVSSVLMAVSTWGMLQTNNAAVVQLIVFCAGLAMAPVFPATLGLIGDRFPKMTATAMGIAITSGCLGLAVSSKIIGTIAGGNSSKLKTALLVLPVFSVLMIGVNLMLRVSLRAPAGQSGSVPA